METFMETFEFIDIPDSQQENKELGKQRILFRLSDINIYHK